MKKRIFSPYPDALQTESYSDQMVDDLLKTDNMPPLPADFADQMAARVVRKMALKQSVKEFFAYIAAVLAAGFVFSGIMYFMDAEIWKRWQDLLLTRYDLLAGLSFILFFILFADRVFFPWIFFRTKGKSSPETEN